MEATINAVQDLNDYEANLEINQESNEINFITQEDIYNIYNNMPDNNINNSFMYFLQNFIPFSESTEKSMWDLLSRIMLNKLRNQEVSTEELNNFITTIYEDTSSKIADYRYLNLIRLALASRNYDLMLKIKNQRISGQE